MITLDTTTLYGGRPADGHLQQRSRELHTWATYKDARVNRVMSVVWAIICALQIAAVAIVAVVSPAFVSQGAVALGLTIWTLGNIAYLAAFPRIFNHFQCLIDRLEGKSPQS